MRRHQRGKNHIRETEDTSPELILALTLVREAEHILYQTVRYERARGNSWADIAKMLGITRTAAYERFAPFCAAVRYDDSGAAYAKGRVRNHWVDISRIAGEALNGQKDTDVRGSQA